jgi:DNA (cytosine-5)-methyltransferase 1
MNQHLFPYKWYLKDGYPSKGITKNNLNVFGTFICGGGSTMGYKLAGYNHLGGVEIDKEVAKVYKLNHDPKYLFNEDIREFNKRQDLPKELYSLDLLDGSPPCSTFSMAGSREKAWGKSNIFTMV